jgi:outer membrane biosynthesis protein TonB
MNLAAVKDEQDLSLQIERCYARIDAYLEVIKRLESELQSIEGELEGISDERQKYELLAGICENLERLNQIGGNRLFWTDLSGEGQVEDRLSHLRDQVSFFERRIKKVTDRQEGTLGEINRKKEEIAYIEDEIAFIKEQEEEAKNEYVVEREFEERPFRVVVMPWTKGKEDEREFQKILSIVLLVTIILGVLVPLYKLPIPDRAQVVEVPERLARLVKKELPKPIPPKEQKKPEEAKKEEKKTTTKEEQQVVRNNVKSKGILAFKNNFADLLEDKALNKLGENANLSNAGSTARRTQRSILTSQATSTSGGINSSSLSHNVAGTGQDITAVAFSRVKSDIGTAVGDDRPLSKGPGPSRTDEEIQIVFDRYKAALYRIYNRELRINPTLQGKVMLRITIEPDGSVSLCRVESAELDSKKLLGEIVGRVKQFNFGAKEGVPPVTILYPIDFLPAS